MKIIRLTQGKIALVDNDDYEVLSQFKWCAKPDKARWYAERAARKNGKTTTVKMHRQIMGFPIGRMDHRNGNGLDNRRKNLRLATPSENGGNSKKSKRNTSGFKGVTLSDGKWRSRIMVQRQPIHLGYFDNAEQAHFAYSVAAKEYFGEYARLK